MLDLAAVVQQVDTFYAQNKGKEAEIKQFFIGRVDKKGQNTTQNISI